MWDDVGSPCHSRRATLFLQRRRPGSIDGLIDGIFVLIKVSCRVFEWLIVIVVVAVVVVVVVVV